MQHRNILRDSGKIPRLPVFIRRLMVGITPVSDVGSATGGSAAIQQIDAAVHVQHWNAAFCHREMIGAIEVASLWSGIRSHHPVSRCQRSLKPVLDVRLSGANHQNITRPPGRAQRIDVESRDGSLERIYRTAGVILRAEQSFLLGGPEGEYE